MVIHLKVLTRLKIILEGDSPARIFFQISEDAKHRICVARRMKKNCPAKMSGFTFDLSGFVKKTLHRTRAEELFLMICEWRKIIITSKDFINGMLGRCFYRNSFTSS